MATNTENTHRGRYIPLLLLAIGGVVLALFSTPAQAQAPLVTPLPGAVATLTAAGQAQQQAQAQQRQGEAMKAQADAARARAAQLEAAGNDAISQGQASYDSAASDAEQATAAIQAQQLGVATEFVTRAQSNIEAGKGQIDAARASLSQMSSIIDAQSNTIISLTNDNQQLRVSNQNWQKSYTALSNQKEQDGKSSTVLSIFGGLLMVAFLLVLLAWSLPIILRRREPKQQPPPEVIDSGYTVTEDDTGA